MKRRRFAVVLTGLLLLPACAPDGGAVAGTPRDATENPGRPSDASTPAQPDAYGLRWQVACAAPPGVEPAVVCVPAGDGRLAKLDDYSTLHVSKGSGPERRMQLLPDTSNGPSRVLVEAPETMVCDLQQVGGRPICGAVATSFRADRCPDPGGSDSCALRPTPYDNAAFPHFPDPEAEGYFAPWPVYEGPGGMPGDLDKLFFENLGDLTAGGFAASASGDDDVLTPAQRRQLDILAWQEFLAIHWPVDDRDGGVRMRASGSSAADGHCPAWAGWRRRDEVMRGPNVLPIPWGVLPSIDSDAEVCAGFLDRSEVAMVSATGAATGESARIAEQPDGSLLFDRNGLLVFYDVRINRALYDFILRNGIFRGEIPEGFEDGIHDIPHGKLWPALGLGLLKANEEYEGPVAAKLAWKQLTDCDDPSRFLVARTALGTVTRQQAVDNLRRSSCARRPDEPPKDGPLSADEARHLAFLDAKGLLGEDALPDSYGPAGPASPPLPPACKPRCEGDTCLLGMVGMHVAHKTSTNARWNWSTFVHRDAFASRDGSSPLFGSGHCEAAGSGQARNCNDCEDGRCVTRLCRTYRPAPATAELNDEIAAMLVDAKVPVLRAASNYEMLGVQWVDQVADPPRPYPADLANPLLETFVTSTKSGDCYSCHVRAEKGDFLFFLADIFPEP
ncbi:MAG: hypothetical protein ABR538_17590 [Candidatus Binatia bacterium]